MRRALMFGGLVAVCVGLVLAGPGVQAQGLTNQLGGDPVAQNAGGPGLGNIPVGQGKSLGEWKVWRPDDRHILVTHAGGKVAIEVTLESNGWFRYYNQGASFVVWSTATQDPQSMAVDPQPYFDRGTSGSLEPGNGRLGSYTYAFDGDVLRIKCDADDETIVVRKSGPSFHFDGFRGAKADFPQGAAGVPAEAASAGGPGLGSIPVGEGRSFGEWKVWRPDDRHILVTHAGGKVAIEVTLESNGWFRYFNQGASFVVWSTAKQDTQGMAVNPGGYFDRATSGSLEPGNGRLGSYTYTFDGDVLRIKCDADDETIVVRKSGPSFHFDGFMGAKGDFPMGAASAPAEAPAEGGPGLGSVPIGQGKSLGEWKVWRPDERHILVTHERGKVAIEVTVESNGWFRYYNQGASFVVWSTATQDPQDMAVNPQAWFGKATSGSLAAGEGRIGSYTYAFDGQTLRIKCDADGETIVVTPTGPSFHFDGYRGAKADFPLGVAPPAGVPKAAVPGGDATIDQIPVGGGVKFGQWGVWRPDDTHLVLTHPGKKVVIEVTLGSNGWFRYYNQGKSFVVWSTATQDPQAMAVDAPGLLAQTPTGTLLTGNGKLGDYRVQFDGREIRIICDADGETIVVKPKKPTFEFLGYKGAKGTFPTKK